MAPAGLLSHSGVARPVAAGPMIAGYRNGSRSAWHGVWLVSKAKQ
jgi:hypothetical protein